MLACKLSGAIGVTTIGRSIGDRKAGFETPSFEDDVLSGFAAPIV
jgi:hypothetical protein